MRILFMKWVEQGENWHADEKGRTEQGNKSHMTSFKITRCAQKANRNVQNVVWVKFRNVFICVLTTFIFWTFQIKSSTWSVKLYNATLSHLPLFKWVKDLKSFFTFQGNLKWAKLGVKATILKNCAHGLFKWAHAPMIGTFPGMF